QTLKSEGIHAYSLPGNVWREPWEIETGQGQPYRVFTPFWSRLRAQVAVATPLPSASPSQWMTLEDAVPLQALGLLPEIDWAQGMADVWQPGEIGARNMLELFADDALNHYAYGRDLPARHGTSRMSPHLHFGEITPQQIHYHLHQRMADVTTRQHPDLELYLRELGWREFANHLLFHFPRAPTENLNPRFDPFPWADNDVEAMQRWQRGRTGIPLVDAGMRELWHTGWMHNRVRMVVASYLTKNLRQHWLHGAHWFWDTLVDADLANNSLGWQWVAGTGADAAPYFPCSTLTRRHANSIRTAST
ncbi:MAG TPA: FAD-binding domain-containing protein, partial [Oleiagrimonas sp.]|nr:FAD-binding domain-containing protein [Oleiagrimonas sp.]